MEHELWTLLYRLVARLRYPPSANVHSDRVILLSFLWSVLHDRPVSWACHRAHWRSTRLRPPRLPSQPTMSRRLRTSSVRTRLGSLVRILRGDSRGDVLKYLDACPLPVGGYSKDPNAKRGYGAGQWFRGYKLHAVWGKSSVPLAFEVRPANQSEPKIARVMVPRLGGGGYILGDSAYDSNALYQQAGERGHQLLAWPKKKGRGLGHREHSEWRLRCRERLGRRYGQELMALRARAETKFGNLSSFWGGLKGLPNWVRTTGRVERWVIGKLILRGCFSLLRE